LADRLEVEQHKNCALIFDRGGNFERNVHTNNLAGKGARYDQLLAWLPEDIRNAWHTKKREENTTKRQEARGGLEASIGLQERLARL
jgi:hypothetical protein